MESKLANTYVDCCRCHSRKEAIYCWWICSNWICQTCLHRMDMARREADGDGLCYIYQPIKQVLINLFSENMALAIIQQNFELSYL